MVASNYSDIPEDDQTIVFDALSCWYDMDLLDSRLYNWFVDKIQRRYIEWKAKCKVEFVEGGAEPVPIEFQHRPEQWAYLVHYFQQEHVKSLGERMKVIRNSEKKINHTSGPTPLSIRAKRHKDAKHPAPRSEAFADAYMKNAPEIAEKVKARAAEAVSEMRAAQDSDAESQDSVTLPLQAEISIIEGEVGMSLGTRVRGFGRDPVRPPRKRGPTAGLNGRKFEIDRIRQELKAEIRAEITEEITRNVTQAVFQDLAKFKDLFSNCNSSGAESNSDMN